MYFNAGIFLAAAGITTLEFAEAAAVGLALYGESRRRVAFLCVAVGVIAVLVPALYLGQLIAYLSPQYVRFVGGSLLLYFGLRLAKSARRSVIKSGTTGFNRLEEFEKGVFATGVSVGAVEAFEAAIVLVGLLPNNYSSTAIGIIAGIGIVVTSTYILRSSVRKVKQANMKVIVSALLLSFSAFWFAEIFVSLSDAYLIPLFLIFLFLVYAFAHRVVLLSSDELKVAEKKDETHRNSFEDKKLQR